MEEFSLLYLVVVVVIALISVFLDTVTQNLTEVLTSRFLDLPQPLLGIIHAIINDILEGALGANQLIYRPHQVRKHANAQKLYNHLEKVLVRSVALEVAVTKRGQRRDDEVNGLYVELVVAIGIDTPVAVVAAAALGFEPAALNCEADADPEAAEDVDCGGHVGDHI